MKWMADPQTTRYHSREAKVITEALRLLGRNGKNWTQHKLFEDTRGKFGIGQALQAARQNLKLGPDKAELLCQDASVTPSGKLTITAISNDEAKDFSEIKALMRAARRLAEREKRNIVDRPDTFYGRVWIGITNRPRST
jgi:hypothetical protein